MKRRICSVLLAVVLLFAVSVVCFADDYSFKMFADADSTDATKGETVSIIFYANDISVQSGLLSLTADIQYDPACLKLLGLSGISPASWGDVTETFYYERDIDGKKIVTVNILYDGDSPEGKGIVNDNEFGVKLDFSVETSAKTQTVVEALTKGLPDSGALCATSGLPELMTVYGEGTTCSFNLNGSVSETTSEEIENSSESVSDTSSDASESVSEGSSENVEENSSVSQVESEASSSALTSEEANVSAESSVAESVSEDKSESQTESKDESASADDEGGINIILWLVIICVIVAAIAVVTYIVKNKKNDMNPVNPG